jgi:hypothetical protein
MAISEGLTPSAGNRRYLLAEYLLAPGDVKVALLRL